MLTAGLFVAALFSTAQVSVPKPADGKAKVDRYGDPLPAGAVVRLGTIRYCFTGQASSFLPDSRTIISVGGSSHFLSLWDARTGRLVRQINTGRLALGASAAFSRGARLIAVSGHITDKGQLATHPAVGIYDTISGKAVRLLERPAGQELGSVALTPDGKFLFSLSGDGKLRVVEVETDQELLQQQFPVDNTVRALAVSPDGKTLALGSGANTSKLFLWNWQAAEEPRTLKAPPYCGHALTFSPNGKWLAECGYVEPTLRIWDVASGRVLRRLEPPDHEPFWPQSLAFSPDGQQLAIWGWNNRRGVVHLWNPVTGKFLKRLDAGSGPLAFSPDGKLLVAGPTVWDLVAGKELSANDETHHGAITRLQTAGKNLVVTAGDDGTVRLWDAATGKQQRKFVHDNWVRAIALSPDARLLVSSSLDDTVCLWDMATGRKIYRLAGHGRMGGRRSVVFTADGRSFLSWGDDMYLRKWKVRNGKAVFEHAIRPTGIKVLHEGAQLNEIMGRFPFVMDGLLTPDGKYLVLQGGFKFFVIDTTNGKELRHFPTEVSNVSWLSVSPDSKLLLATAWGEIKLTKLPDGRMQQVLPKDHPVKWWDLTTGQLRRQLRLPEQGAGPVAFSPDGRRFAVASSRPGNHIRIIELLTGQVVHHIEGFPASVQSLAFLPDGRRLVSGMDDGTALIWDLTQKR
jgi:WD40 repeat protein